MPKRRRLSPEARRQEILEAALRLLHDRGNEVRVEDITAEAGAAKGTFFAYFPTWHDLLEAVRAHHVAEFKARHGEGEGAENWREVLPGLAARFIDFILELGGTHEVLFHSEFTLARPLPPQDRPAARIAAILRAGQAEGAYATLDPEAGGRLIFAMIHETADAIAAGADRVTALSALILSLHRMTKPEPRP